MNLGLAGVVNTAAMEWQPVFLEKKTIEGIFVKYLRFDQDNKRPLTFLFKLQAGAIYPLHKDPGGGQVFILEGEVQYGLSKLKTGDYYITPPDDKLIVISATGCVMFYAL